MQAPSEAMLPKPTPIAMEEAPEAPPESFDDKIRRVFGNAAIDKRRLPASKLQSRSIPGYVAEWVLDYIVPGDGPLTSAEITKVQEWAARVVPGSADGNQLRDRLIRGETLKILTPVQVDVVLNRTRQERVARLSQIGIHDAAILPHLVQKFPALLDEGMWGVTELIATEEGVSVISFKPMQAQVSLEGWKQARREWSLDEWRDLLLLSMGYAPQSFKPGEKMLLLCRLLPLVQKNMHLLELAPKGTGKSYIYENISPRVRLTGGNVTPAKLFVDNAKGTPGYLSRYKVVVLDEVQTLKFSQPDEIVANLKIYLANAQIQRGTTSVGSDCGFVMLANITLDENQEPMRDLLVEELPAFMRETAFLDRLSALIPGWKIPKLSSASFATGLGLKSDFFGDTLLALREDAALDALCARRIEFSGKTYGRNMNSIRAVATGLFKLLFPHGEASDEEFRQHCLRYAIELRQGIWSQLYKLDNENQQFERDLRRTVSHRPSEPAIIAPELTQEAGRDE